MAVETTNAHSGPYTANGVTTAFPFTFSAMTGDDVTVISRSAAGVDTTVSSSAYSVALTGTAPSSGTVTFITAPSAGVKIILLLDPEFTQETEFENGSPWLASPVNNANDRSALRDQVLKRDVDRAIKLAVGEDGLTFPALAARAGKFIAFDAGGALVPASGSGADGALREDLADPSGAGLAGYDPSTSYSAGSIGDQLQGLAQAPTGEFYTEQGARVQYLRDRVFVAAAGEHTGTNDSEQSDWLTEFLMSKGRTFGFQHTATMAVLSENNFAGQNAFLSGARTSQLTAAGNVVGMLGVGINDNTAHNTGAWGGYFEGFQDSGALGPCYALEADPINFNAVANSTAYTQAANQVVGFQMAASGEFATGVFPISAAFALRKNGSTFDKGVIFGNDALTGTTGNGTGSGIAIQAACGHGFQWLTPTATIGAQIFGNSTTTAGSTTLSLSEGATIFSNSSSGKTLLQVISGSNYINFINLLPSIAGAPVSFAAAGDDTNIGIQLTPKGAAYVRVPIGNVPTFVNDAAAAAGGISVGEFYRNGSALMIRAA